MSEPKGLQFSREELESAVSGRREWALRALEDLVREPSLLGQEEGAQDVASRLFAELGYEVRDEPISLAEIEGKPGFSPVDWRLEGKRNVVALHEPDETLGRSLIFNGHVDVVSPEPVSLWTSSPWEPRLVANEEDGETWVYGRGAGDMKGGSVAYLWALQALRDLGATPAAKVILQSVVEEECTGNGALSLLEKGYRADAAIIPEPFNETLLTAQVGVIWFRVRVLGKTTHVLGAGRGVNAIEMSWPIVEALRELEREVNAPGSVSALFEGIEHPINLNVGTIRGGDWQSTVAGECVTGFRFGLFPGTALESVKTLVEERVAAAAAKVTWLAENPPAVEWVGFQAEGSVFDPDSSLGQTIREAHKAWRGAEPEQLRCTATTDIRFFNNQYGIPATCYGPKALRIHGVDEKVSVDSMQRVAEVFCSVVQDWCRLGKAP